MYWFVIAAGVLSIASVLFFVPHLSRAQDDQDKSESQRQVITSFTRGLHTHAVIGGVLIVVGIVAAVAGWSDTNTMMAFFVVVGVAFASMAVTVVAAMPAIRAAAQEAKGEPEPVG